MKIQCKYDQLVPIKDITKHPDNPNTHPELQLKGLQVTLKENQIRHPLIVSRPSGYLVAGHARLEVMKDLGMKKVPVVYQDFDNPEKEYQFMVSDNESQRKSWFNPVKFDQSIKKLKFDKVNYKAMGIYDSIVKIDYGQSNESPQKDNPEHDNILDNLNDTDVDSGKIKPELTDEKISITCPECGHTFFK